MRFSLKAKVLSSAVLREATRFHHNDIAVVIFPDQEGLLSEIHISKAVENYLSYLPTIDASVEPPRITLNSPSEDLEKLRGWLQYLESLLSFYCGIHRIDWQFPDQEWIPENEEERTQLSVSGFTASKRYDPAFLEFRPDVFYRALIFRDKLEYLKIPMAFYREGDNHFNSFQYIEAYWKFYFFLEALYSNGKSKNDQVVKEFQKSREIRHGVEKIVAKIQSDPDKRHINNIVSLLDKLGLVLSTDDVIAMLVELRGKLLHFSLKSTQVKGHPFNQMEFESAAYLIMAVCIECIVRLTSGPREE